MPIDSLIPSIEREDSLSDERKAELIIKAAQYIKTLESNKESDQKEIKILKEQLASFAKATGIQTNSIDSLLFLLSNKDAIHESTLEENRELKKQLKKERIKGVIKDVGIAGLVVSLVVVIIKN